MLRVAAGELPETLRIARPGPIVAFGKRDVVTAGYPDAVRAARAGGFEAVEGLAGGRAAVFHEDTIAFAHADPGRGRPHADRRALRGDGGADGGGVRAPGRGRPGGRGRRASTAPAPTA